MDNSPEKVRAVEADKLDSAHYFESLLQQAQSKHLLAEGDLERLGQACLGLLVYQTERYCGGESSSIRVEKAQELMTSILFTISVWLKTYENPDDAVAVLQREPLPALFQEGRARVDEMTAQAKAVHTALCGRLLDSPNIFYRATVVGGIGGFFKRYNPDFLAQEIHITADYPLFLPVPKLDGIEFIGAYLKGLYLENLFLICFDRRVIHRLLCGYVPDYQNDVLNLYEPVISAALGCVLAEGDLQQLDLTPDGAARLYHLLEHTPPGALSPLLEGAAQALLRVLDLTPELARYVQESLPSIAARTAIAAREGFLNRVFVTPGASLR